MKLLSVKLHNFRGILDQEVQFQTYSLLVGPNNAGKSTFIDGIRAFYEKDGTWGIEGHGVDPDIEVIDDPAKMVNGGDPQLDFAIQHMLTEIQQHPYIPPKAPSYPDRRGMGIEQKDR